MTNCQYDCANVGHIVLLSNIPTGHQKPYTTQNAFTCTHNVKSELNIFTSKPLFVEIVQHTYTHHNIHTFSRKDIIYSSYIYSLERLSVQPAMGVYTYICALQSHVQLYVHFLYAFQWPKGCFKSTKTWVFQLKQLLTCVFHPLTDHSRT